MGPKKGAKAAEAPVDDPTWEVPVKKKKKGKRGDVSSDDEEDGKDGGAAAEEPKKRLTHREKEKLLCKHTGKALPKPERHVQRMKGSAKISKERLRALPQAEAIKKKPELRTKEQMEADAVEREARKAAQAAAEAERVRQEAEEEARRQAEKEAAFAMNKVYIAQPKPRASRVQAPAAQAAAPDEKAWVCEYTKKRFKSQATWDNHVKSKKYRQLAERAKAARQAAGEPEPEGLGLGIEVFGSIPCGEGGDDSAEDTVGDRGGEKRPGADDRSDSSVESEEGSEKEEKEEEQSEGEEESESEGEGERAVAAANKRARAEAEAEAVRRALEAEAEQEQEQEQRAAAAAAEAKARAEREAAEAKARAVREQREAAATQAREAAEKEAMRIEVAKEKAREAAKAARVEEARRKARAAALAREREAEARAAAEAAARAAALAAVKGSDSDSEWETDSDEEAVEAALAEAEARAAAAKAAEEPVLLPGQFYVSKPKPRPGARRPWAAAAGGSSGGDGNSNSSAGSTPKGQTAVEAAGAPPAEQATAKLTAPAALANVGERDVADPFLMRVRPKGAARARDSEGAEGRRDNKSGPEAEAAEEVVAPWEAVWTECLFDGHHSTSLVANAEYMRVHFGFTVLEVAKLTLVDMEGLFSYLQEKVCRFHTCIQCGREFTSLEACRKHMVDKWHCRANLSVVELAEFFVPTEGPEEEEEAAAGEEFWHDDVFVNTDTKELVLLNGSRLLHRSTTLGHSFHNQKFRYDRARLRRRAGMGHGVHGMSLYLAQREQAMRTQGMLVKSMSFAKGSSKAIASNYVFKHDFADNAARRAIRHHWGEGGGGAHYTMAGSRQFQKGVRIKGVVSRHSKQGAVNGARRQQAAANRANRGNKSTACLQ